ncbi:Metallo-dependent phosphatase-like protein [Zychaea mexicana]|uniref:Metallo-dependent phosphatase-like protein n=1 Tax=Zychaea mexicana TaxID=64656 RepID=UPI0022FDDC62|nr:Metallo-dependent phosphatase-like protein [Zychaea mexicana]KAI9495013.1 Metallo-dependent phosphatase-like protein [Zychaea mexicana]
MSSVLQRTVLLLSLLVVVANQLVTARTGKFLHITDIHLDSSYVEGSDPEQLCHRGTGNAGPLGAVRTKCDSSPALVKKTFDFIANKYSDVDFVIYTGDSARHDRDDDLPRSMENVINEQKEVVGHFNKIFGPKVYPVIGNNDVEPHNSCDENDEQFKTIASIWQPLALNTSNHHYTRGGYFYEDVVPGKIRTVHTNTLLFYKDNKKAKADCKSPDGIGSMHLAWLKDVLEESRQQGYSVYILAHIPPTSKKGKAYYTDDCLDGYLSLLGTYKETVVGHFAGHYNNDILSAIVEDDGKYKQLSALKKKKTIKRKTVKSSNFITPLFNTPSVIPTFNPSIRVFTYETEGTKQYPVGTILDWHQYYLNMDDNGRDYELEYQASKLFNVNHFDGKGVEKAFTLMLDNQSVHKEYLDHVTVNTDDNDQDDD